MRDDVLRHYDEKYAHESRVHVEAAAEPVIRRTPAPTTRYEACVGTLLDHFRGNDLIEIGAGSGLLARSLLAADLPCRHYVATEFSRSRLAGLERALPDPRVDVRVLDIEQPGDEHLGSYDGVVMLALIEPANSDTPPGVRKLGVHAHQTPASASAAATAPAGSSCNLSPLNRLVLRVDHHT